jgi:hypothetical protein
MIQGSRDLDDSEDRLGDNDQPPLRRSHPLLPAPERGFVDPDEPGKMLSPEALRLARNPEPSAKPAAGRVRAAAEEIDEPRGRCSTASTSTSR